MLYQANGLRFIDAKRHPFGMVEKSCRSVNNKTGKISSAITSCLTLVTDVVRCRIPMNFDRK